ncbi:MAG: Flp family type IVb pilin, partial [Nocardioides sp.]
PAAPSSAPHHSQEGAGLVKLDIDSEQRDERGATAVEYGLMVGLIAIVIIAAVIVAVVVTLGQKINTAFETVDTEL